MNAIAQGWLLAVGLALAAGGAAATDLRAGELIGRPVRNAAGEGLGQIQDLALDVHNSRVQYALLRFPGFLGFGDKRFAYPLPAFGLAENGELRLPVARSALKQARGLPARREPEAAPEAVGLGGAAPRGPVALPNQKLRWASELSGRPTLDPNGEPVGHLRDFVVSLDTGRVHYLALERSGGAGERLVALPLSSFSFTEDRREAIVHVPKARLDVARGFEPGAWPTVERDEGYLLAAAPLAGQEPTPADLGDAAPAELEAVFDELDTNGDGTLTSEEAAANAWIGENWEALDHDHDGLVRREDLQALQPPAG